MLTPWKMTTTWNWRFYFERELLLAGLELSEPGPGEPHFAKAWRVIRAIRRRAAPYLADPAELRPYYWGLLHATLTVLYYHADQFAGKSNERRQKRYAFMPQGCCATGCEPVTCVANGLDAGEVGSASNRRMGGPGPGAGV